MNFLKKYFGRPEDTSGEKTLFPASFKSADAPKIGPLSEVPSETLTRTLRDAAKRRPEIQAIVLANILVEHEEPHLVAGVGFVAGTEPSKMEHCIGALWESVTRASEELSSLVYLKLNSSEILQLFERSGVCIYGDEKS